MPCGLRYYHERLPSAMDMRTELYKEDPLQRREKTEERKKHALALVKQAQHSPGIFTRGKGIWWGDLLVNRGDSRPDSWLQGGRGVGGGRYTDDIAQQCTATCTRFVTRL